MESFGYKPSAQSDEPTQAQPETRREDLTQHAPSPREALPEEFRVYKVLKRMTGTSGEAQTFLVEKENQRYVLKLYHSGKTPDREVLRQIREMTEEGKRYFPILYEHGEEGGKYYEVVEYIAGGDLGAWIKKTPSEKRLEKLPDIVRQIAEALHILHERKLIHRDLKPANVLLRSEEPLELVLIDFGISRQIDREATKHATVVFKGTPAYCAPEEFSGLFGREADWWHLGIVAYEVIKGEHPFAGVNQAVISYQIITQDIPLPDTVDRYRVLLRGLLNRDPKKRWGYEQVRAWLEGKVEFAQETSPRSPIQYSLQDWEKAGFTEVSARLWAELGLSPEEAQSFDEAGFSVEEARPWVEVGFKNAKRCKKWREAGFKPEETQVYESFGLNIEHAKRLKAWKITALHLSDYRGQTKLTNSLNNLLTDLDSLKANPHSPPEWVSELLDDPELSSVLSNELERRHRSSTHSEMLKALGGELASAMVEQLTPDLLIEAAQQEVSAAELLKAQVYGVPLMDYLKYRRYGLSLMQASKLFQAGAKPEDYAKGAEQGLTYSEILEVFRRKVDLSEYLHFRRYGFTPEQAEELLRAGVKSKDYAKDAEQGLTYAEMLEVFQRKVDLSEYLHFRRYGFTPEQAEELLQAGVKSEDYAKGMEQGLTYLEVLEISRRGVNLSEYLHLRKYGITLRESTFVAQGLQKIAIEGPLSVSSPLIIEKSSLTLKNLSLRTLRVSDSQVSLEGCSFPNGGAFPSPRLEIVSSEVALEGVHVVGGKVGIQVRDSRLTLREVSLTGLSEVGMQVEGQTTVEGDLLSIRQCGRGMEVRPSAQVHLTRPTLSENGTGIAVAEAGLVLKGPGELTYHQGPAILVEKNGTLSAEELTFEKNQRDDSDDPTAQIHLVGASKVSLQKITVQNSEAIGLYAKNCPDIRMTNSTFTSNRYGAIRLEKSRLIASEVEIFRNGGVGDYWQVALFDQAHLKIEKSIIGSAYTGGIYAESSEVEVADCIVKLHWLDGLQVKDSSTARVVGGRFWANSRNQIAGYNNSTVEVRDAVLDGKASSSSSHVGLFMQESHVVIKKCQIRRHYEEGVRVEGASECTIEDSQLEENGLLGHPQLFVKEVKKVALSDLRVIGGYGGGVYLSSCRNASLSGKSIIRGHRSMGLWAWLTRLTVEQVEFQDNGKKDMPFSYYHGDEYERIPYYYQIFAGGDSYVQLKEVQIYEGQRSGGILVRHEGTLKLEGGSIHGHGREAIAVQDSGSKIVVVGARIFGNAQKAGAQVIVKDSGTAEMEDACIQDSPRGGAWVGEESTLILKRCQVHNNKAYNLKREWAGRVEFIDMPPVED
jgi:serine/threonine protein kinase